MYTRKSWREKMNNPNLPKVVSIPANLRKRYGEGAMLLPSPIEVEALIQAVPEGSLTTVGEIRSTLAGKYSVATACPLVTGICVRLVAEAAEEAARAGASSVTPYWRVVKDDGSLNPKFPGGVARQAERLRAEGHRISRGATRIARTATAR